MQNQYISAVFWHHFYLNSLKIHLVIPVIKGGTATAIIMKKFKKIIPLALAVTLTCASLPMIARADSSKVVTIGTNLSDDQKKSMYEYFGTSKDSVETIEVTATEELVTTGELADDIGQDKATDLMNDVKEDVIANDISDEDKIADTVDEKAKDLDVNLTDEQKDKIVSLMEKISQYDYDVKSLQQTLNNLEGKSEGFFTKLVNNIKGFFGGNDSNSGGIISQTKDDILGSDVVSNSTLDDIKDKVQNADTDGWWDKVVNFFKGLTGSNSDSSDSNSSDDSSSN